MNFLSLFFVPSLVLCAEFSQDVESNSGIHFASSDKELIFSKMYLPHLFHLSLITNYFKENESFPREQTQPYEEFLSAVSEYFISSGSWQSTFWNVCFNHSQHSFLYSSLHELERSMKAALKWYDIRKDGEVTIESVKDFLLSLYQKHYLFPYNLQVSDETMFIFLTFLVHRLHIPVDAEILI